MELLASRNRDSLLNPSPKTWALRPLYVDVGPFLESPVAPKTLTAH